MCKQQSRSNLTSSDLIQLKFEILFFLLGCKIRCTSGSAQLQIYNIGLKFSYHLPLWFPIFFYCFFDHIIMISQLMRQTSTLQCNGWVIYFQKGFTVWETQPFYYLCLRGFRIEGEDQFVRYNRCRLFSLGEKRWISFSSCTWLCDMHVLGR